MCKDFCQFIVTLKNAAGDPILGYTACVKAMYYMDDGPSMPLQVYDAGNGNYMFFNRYRAYCKECGAQTETRSAYRSYCNYCHEYDTMVWNQWVSVLINGKRVTGSPFKLVCKFVSMHGVKLYALHFMQLHPQ